MKFIWGKGCRSDMNHTLAFCISGNFSGDASLNIYASNSYRIFVNGELKNYGPERTAAGYSRLRELNVSNAKNIVVEVAGYNVATFCNSLELPYFACEIIENGNVVADSLSFSCHKITDRKERVQRFALQRNFIEYYDQSFDKSKFYNGDFSLYPQLETEIVEPPLMICGNEDFSSYEEKVLSLIDSGKASRSQNPVAKTRFVWWADFIEEGKMDGFKKDDCDIDIVSEVSRLDVNRAGNLDYSLYSAPTAITGLIKVKVNAKKDSTIYLTFDEISDSEENEKPIVTFTRPVIYNTAIWKVKKGEYELLTFEPYELKYLTAFIDGDVQILEISVIQIANKNINNIEFSCSDKKVEKVFEAGKNTFAQNAVDIFMDCPSRERAGWLCDSFFTSKAEQLIVGNNKIEKNFLENFVICTENNIPKGMLPMSYPSEHKDGTYIPNWAMWFVKELGDYYTRTNDLAFVEKAKQKVYDVAKFFEKYLNSDGLLENLESWVFIEWSVANEPDYICGVNYPSNMMYASMLETIGMLYNDAEYLSKAKKVKDKIYEQSFNGEFFIDNAVRDESGNLSITEHISETCQYYALICGIKTDKDFEDKIINEFGPKRAEDKYRFVGKSNAFIGNYLRLLWLLSKEKYDVVKDETIDYFYYMAERTGTLWEHQSTEASCNHGFTSVICVFIAQMLFGYLGYSEKENAIFIKKSFLKSLDSSIKIPVLDGYLSIQTLNGERTIKNQTKFEMKYV